MMLSLVQAEKFPTGHGEVSIPEIPSIKVGEARGMLSKTGKGWSGTRALGRYKGFEAHLLEGSRLEESMKGASEGGRALEGWRLLAT
jgi:hypothetical protein